jgi:malonyl-CoA O-methyltransferase
MTEFRKGLRWIEKFGKKDYVQISDRNFHPYPEVTGYFIPTLLQIGDFDRAHRFSSYLMSIQNEDGSFFLDNPAQKFVFDTGQVIRGWVAIAPRYPEVLEPLRRACHWIVSTSDASGCFAVPPKRGAWSLGARGEVSEGIHLYIVQPLRNAAELLGEPALRRAADRALNNFLSRLPLTSFEAPNALSHFYAYMQEALFETGCHDLAAAGMKSVASYQQHNGCVPGYHDASWVCSPGLAQCAKVWFLLGERARARAALDFMRSLQNHTGGFYGSYGIGASYFAADEISWAVKYFLDAELLAIADHFNATALQYGRIIPPDDGRAQAVLANCPGARRILDVGCGNGRYATLVNASFPNAEVWGVDVSAEMLAAVPGSIQTRIASIQDLPFQDGAFDLVYCIEALEHAPNPAAAVAEMARLVQPGGRLLVVDKNIAIRGRLQTEPWEVWFDRAALSAIIEGCGMSCQVSELSYDRRPADGLFLCWVGQRAGG